MKSDLRKITEKEKWFNEKLNTEADEGGFVTLNWLDVLLRPKLASFEGCTTTSTQTQRVEEVCSVLKEHFKDTNDLFLDRHNLLLPASKRTISSFLERHLL